MRIFDFLKSVKSPEQRLAWLVALAADAIQIVALPLFAPGGFSPADTLLDLVVAGVLLRLLGWHWAFLPTFAAELVPGLDLFPTWTAAVFFATRKQIGPGEPEILPPGPAPRREIPVASGQWSVASGQKTRNRNLPTTAHCPLTTDH